ncbi:UNVERIFIED_CONTAM: hypothetical protein PYX00_010755 [Menopon gallinae]|uniref:Major facilitator superfamily (MFS) profile domain-containing protein n=1 Tax=Menopon gallinae TaxID=328185 RepID=A0AAW2HH84_9NEOP
MHWLSARWIPQSERSKFMTSYHGAAVGTAITYPLSGLIITCFGWDYVFYFIGSLTLIWCLAWWILVYDSPSVHPRISQEELDYLKREIGDLVTTAKDKKVKTPWRAILNSKAVWAVMAASQGLMWGTITLSMQIPQYFHQVHHLDIKTNGLLSGIPEVGKFFFALLFSSFIDRIISRKLVTVTNARKLAVVFCEYIPAGLLLILGFFASSNTTLAVVLLALTYSVGGASSSGSLANIVDLSPNHAGTILGIIKTLTIVPGVISPLVATYFTKNNDSGSEVALHWRSVFIVMAAVYTFCCTIFMIFGSGEVQSWNQTSNAAKEDVILLEVEKLPSKAPEGEREEVDDSKLMKDTGNENA